MHEECRNFVPIIFKLNSKINDRKLTGDFVLELSLEFVLLRDALHELSHVVFSVRPGDTGLQRPGDGNALDDAGRRMSDRCRFRASGAARSVHLLADALSLRKLAGKRQSYVTCIKRSIVHGQTMRERVSSFRLGASTIVYRGGDRIASAPERMGDFYRWIPR